MHQRPYLFTDSSLLPGFCIVPLGYVCVRAHASALWGWRFEDSELIGSFSLCLIGSLWSERRLAYSSLAFISLVNKAAWFMPGCKKSTGSNAMFLTFFKKEITLYNPLPWSSAINHYPREKLKPCAEGSKYKYLLHCSVIYNSGKIQNNKKYS